jgi:hypothetical protein
VWTDDVWVVDSTPVECARSRETVRGSELAGWAEYGYCASHSRYFWGLPLHLVATLHGLHIGYALTGAQSRRTPGPARHALRRPHPGRVPARADPARGQELRGRDFEASIADAGIQLLRRARKDEPERAGGRFFQPLRQTVESIFDTLKGQLHLEQHGGRTPTGVLVRILQRMLAMTTAIWHNDRTGQPIRRSLLACDH